MKRVCAWCGKGMGEKEPLKDKSVTHGMCEECLEKVMNEGGLKGEVPDSSGKKACMWPLMLTEREMRLLHWCVEHHAPREAFPLPQEDIELKDLKARLEAAIVEPMDEADAALQLIPERLRSVVRRILWSGDDHVAAAIWCEEDVICRAEERGMEITQEQAQQIIATIDRKQDASLGITWFTIDYLLDELK